MRSIKYFKYASKKRFERFIRDYEYSMDDVVGFSSYDKEQYHGNILKTYVIYFSDHDHAFFKEVIFKDFNEYRQSLLGFNGEKLLNWYQDADAREYRKGKW